MIPGRGQEKKGTLRGKIPLDAKCTFPNSEPVSSLSPLSHIAQLFTECMLRRVILKINSLLKMLKNLMDAFVLFDIAES